MRAVLTLTITVCICVCQKVLVGFGGNNNYQVFNNAYQPSPFTPSIVPNSYGLNITSLGSGSQMANFLTSDGVVYAWGNNANRQLGRNASYGTDMYPQPVLTKGTPLEGLRVTNLYSGFFNILMKASDGKIYAVGSAAGAGSASDVSTPVLVDIPNSASVTSISGETNIWIAHTSFDNKLYAWGSSNRYGEQGQGTQTTTSSKTPIPVNMTYVPNQVVKLRTGSSFSVILDGNGIVYTWGLGNRGQNGNGATTNVLQPRPLSNSNLSSKTFKDIAACSSSTVLLGTDGNIYVVGDNANGQFGNGVVATDVAASATLVGYTTMSAFGGRTIASLYAGLYSVGALTTDGTIFVWGIVSGVATSNPTIVPNVNQVMGSSRISQMFINNDGGLVLGSNGLLYGFGSFGTSTSERGTGYASSYSRSTPIEDYPSTSFFVNDVVDFVTSSSSTLYL
ncbi:IPT/TIG domain-containing protein, partial [Acrasis kona]